LIINFPNLITLIEKYITGIVNNNHCQLYAIYANPEHVHMFVSKSPSLDEESLATIIANSSERFINENKLCVGMFFMAFLKFYQQTINKKSK